MSQQHARRKHWLSACDEIHPDDGVDPAVFFDRRSRSRSVDRKARQLCGEAARIFNLLLASEGTNQSLEGAWVAEVQPAPDASRLQVTVAVDRHVDPDAALQALQHMKGAMRTALAQTLQRKRTPELVFVVAPASEEEPWR